MPLPSTWRAPPAPAAPPPSVAAPKRRAWQGAQRSRRTNGNGEDPSDYLRRRRGGPTTRARYDQCVTQVMAASGLRGTPTPAILDPALDRHLTARYFAGDSLTEIRYAYYAIRWHFVLPDSSLPLSKSTMDGFGRLQPAQMRDPVTYEDTVLRANWMLASDPSAEGADAAAATLLTLDLYSRAAHILLVQPRTRCRRTPVSARGTGESP